MNIETRSILDDPRFAATFARLASVSLSPRRHTAANALEHSRAVAARAGALARANTCTDAQANLLEDLGLAHDIGKVTGTARPERSLEVLRECGIDRPDLLSLVKWHDTSLPWYRAQERGQPPTEKAWRRLTAELDLRLLVLFMVADRVDAPPGWRRNAPTIWFLDQARQRGLLPELTLDLEGEPSQISAGGALRHQGHLLLIRTRASGYELPKGGIEWDELPQEAAERETREEAGITTPLQAGQDLGHLDYPVGTGPDRHTKRVRYFALSVTGPLDQSEPPRQTKELRWLAPDEVEDVPLIDERLRPLLRAALLV